MPMREILCFYVLHLDLKKRGFNVFVNELQVEILLELALDLLALLRQAASAAVLQEVLYCYFHI